MAAGRSDDGELSSDVSPSDERVRSDAEAPSDGGEPSDIDELSSGTELPDRDDLSSGVEPGVHRTGRWRGLGAATLLAGGLGLVSRRPALLLVSAFGIALVAYARVVPAPPLSLAVRRTTSPQSVDPGEALRVRLVVENVGERTIPDLRLVDGVPRLLEVVDGTPTLGTTLRPGETATVAYAVETRRGSHQFEPAVAVARDVVGVVERRDHVTVDEDDGVDVAPSTTLRTAPPLRTSVPQQAGREPTDESGEGLAFDTVREYRRGDPPRRINWRTLARTGDLTTVEYRTEGATAVVVAVDARPRATRAPTPSQPTAVERASAAGIAIGERLADDGHHVGVATLDARRQWLQPNAGPEHRHRVRELLSNVPSSSDPRPSGATEQPNSTTEQHDDTTHQQRDTTEHPRDATDQPSDGAELASEPVEGSSTTTAADDPNQLGWLREQVSGQTEVLVLSPLLDDDVVDLARHLEASGTPVTVLSPDTTDDGTPGRRLARLERSRRLQSLRGAGVPVADWERGESLDRVVDRLRTNSRRAGNP